MEVLYDCCCGLDVHAKTVVVDDGFPVERDPHVELHAVGALGLRRVEGVERVLDGAPRGAAVPDDAGG